ncbi:Glucans biosynthesis protein G precursor [Planctopirus ephydatiae]|uniref:Glucans biosynthesis protein G n=2 Tax=Planctopirus ephydatiae TaxID=2528019 RepID=A0A518GM40_9PLAN|nr:Glucans biosynthesis protein G precursor [Planctopirus ephydatiae]
MLNPTLAARVMDSLLPESLFAKAGRMAAVFSKTLFFCSMTFVSMANDSPPKLESRMSHVQSFADLDLVASELAKGPVLPTDPLPQSLAEMTYDQHRMIRFRPERSFWLDEKRPYWLQTFHRGFVHKDQVQLYLLESLGLGVAAQNSVRPRLVEFDKAHFKYEGDLKAGDLPADLGYAGVRFIGFFPGNPQYSEVASFVGASYFRAHSEKTVWGSSARGLAINCGLPKAEEFPVFRAFYVQQPKPGDLSLTFLALLDSESVAGAYQFVMTPGVQATTFDVTARLHFRKVPEKLGIAPLTSMWMWGDALAGPKGDHRPEVHDADGLLMKGGDGQWAWRSFYRQNYPSLVRYPFEKLAGFGVIQRDRNSEHYKDDEARYSERPSVWIEPQVPWEKGALELLELPAEHEGIDNVATWWVPDQKPVVGQPLDLKYRVSFFGGDPPEHQQAKVTAVDLVRESPKKFVFRVDLTGARLAEANPEKVNLELISIRCAITSQRIEKVSDQQWVLHLVAEPTGEGPLELIARLSDEGQPITERWSYLCPLEAPPVVLPPWRVQQNQQETSR